MGRPAEGYPFDWSVYEWLPGQNANGTIDELDRAAVDLAAFVTALRRVDTTGAHPRPPRGRGGPLAEGDEQVRRSIAQLGDRIDGEATLRSWQESLNVRQAQDSAPAGRTTAGEQEEPRCVPRSGSWGQVRRD
jgi:aminoglycoside phosphotransferase (APT) family kinase protein